MITRLVPLILLEWGTIAVGVIVAGAATTPAEMAPALGAVAVASVFRMIANSRANARIVDSITDALRGVGAPSNDGGRRGR